MLADKCFNGNADTSKAGSDCVDNLCPALTSGSTCSPTGALDCSSSLDFGPVKYRVCVPLTKSCFLNADLCVKGAKCIEGKCYPVNKVFATAVTSSPSPTTAVCCFPDLAHLQKQHRFYSFCLFVLYRQRLLQQAFLMPLQFHQSLLLLLFPTMPLPISPPQSSSR